jgi:hypothetical protein
VPFPDGKSSVPLLQVSFYSNDSNDSNHVYILPSLYDQLLHENPKPMNQGFKSNSVAIGKCVFHTTEDILQYFA